MIPLKGSIFEILSLEAVRYFKCLFNAWIRILGYRMARLLYYRPLGQAGSPYPSVRWQYIFRVNIRTSFRSRKKLEATLVTTALTSVADCQALARWNKGIDFGRDNL